MEERRIFTLPDILAPARTPAQLEARRLALEEQERLCREQPVHCEEGGGHAH